MKKSVVLISALLLSDAVPAKAGLNGRLAVSGLPASPHQLLILNDFKPAADGMWQRGKDGLVKPGEFARFEPSEKMPERDVSRAEKEYTLSPVQRVIFGLGLREAR